MVDKKKIGLVQGVDISFLTEQAQEWVQIIMEETGTNISTVQSAKLKEYGKKGELTMPMVRLILTEEKPKERKITLKAEKISKGGGKNGRYNQVRLLLRNRSRSVLFLSCSTDAD